MRSHCLTSDAWYPLVEDYYERSALDEIPVRQGDLLEPLTPCVDAAGDRWLACLVVHPSCEVVTGKSKFVQVCRVRALSEHDANAQIAIVAGEKVTEGATTIAFANTFFLPPAQESGPYAIPMFADLRQVAMAPTAEVAQPARVAALAHDTRVHFIRRSLYWRQRWLLTTDVVREYEAHRISKDSDFKGPRPDWAPAVG
jgi:hypothetical protein